MDRIPRARTVFCCQLIWHLFVSPSSHRLASWQHSGEAAAGRLMIIAPNTHEIGCKKDFQFPIAAAMPAAFSPTSEKTSCTVDTSEAAFSPTSCIRRTPVDPPQWNRSCRARPGATCVRSSNSGLPCCELAELVRVSRDTERSSGSRCSGGPQRGRSGAPGGPPRCRGARGSGQRGFPPGRRSQPSPPLPAARC